MKEPAVSGRDRKAFSSLQSCLTDSSLIDLILTPQNTKNTFIGGIKFLLRPTDCCEEQVSSTQKIHGKCKPKSFC